MRSRGALPPLGLRCKPLPRGPTMLTLDPVATSRPDAEPRERYAQHGPNEQRDTLHMGTLHYGGSDDPIHIEERALAHLKVVIATKLRRQESFTLSWRHPDGDPEGRSTIWLHPSIPMRFTFDEPEAPRLNVKWVEALMHSANSSGGITLVDEVLETPEE